MSDMDEAMGVIDNACRNGLSHVDLSGLQLTTLPPELATLTHLTQLFLDGNQLITLPDSLSALTNLTTLYLDGNQLTTLPDSLSALTNLTTLHLDDNQLTILPDWLADLNSLNLLSVTGNPLLSPPPEILVRGTESILTFIRARTEGSSAQWVSKLLVVGEGGVGKTSLIKALAEDRHDPDEPTTHGLQIRSLYFDHPSKPSVRMLLNAWDFGGQEIYHATHQFFLTNRSLFLLLWNSRLGWEQGRLRYWLKIITARAPESPIIIVATHIEGRPVDLPIDELRREHPMIIDSLSVDNEQRHGIDILRARLTDEAATLPLMGSEWPTTWLAAADSLRKSPEKYVTPEVMWQLMSNAGVHDASQQHDIAVALHELGDILYYHDDHELSQTVVLRPKWVNEYISKVLDSDEVATAEGLLTHRHLTELWSDLDRGLREHFLGMMDKYDLSYRVEGGSSEDVSLVVERLPWNPPPFQAQWDAIADRADTHEIRVQYQLSTMPPGIPTWFIARSHRFSMRTHWRSGALLRHTDGRHVALARADRHRNIVELTVRGPSPTAFFSILDDGLNRTLERFPGLGILRQVPCPCQDGTGNPHCAELFDYNDLQRRLSRTPPRYDIECRKSGEDVPVPQLLLGLAPSERDTTRASLEHIRKEITRVDGKLTEHAEYSQRMFLRLQRMAQVQQEARCPSIFAIVPTARNRLVRRLTGSTYELRLYCEEPGAWHRLPEPAGCYDINEPAEWLRRFGPYLQYLLTVLKQAAPLAGPILGMSVDKLDEKVKSDCDLMKELVAQAPARLDHKGHFLISGASHLGPSARAASDADFRELQGMLGELDPRREWGGLSRTTTPEGLTLYLCREHLATYYQPVRL